LCEPSVLSGPVRARLESGARRRAVMRGFGAVPGDRGFGELANEPETSVELGPLGPTYGGPRVSRGNTEGVPPFAYARKRSFQGATWGTRKAPSCPPRKYAPGPASKLGRPRLSLRDLSEAFLSRRMP